MPQLLFSKLLRPTTVSRNYVLIRAKGLAKSRKQHVWKTLRNWQDCQKFLGDRDLARIYRYLAIIKREHGIAVRYQNTDIVTFNNDGTISVNAGGWQTKTTKKYINMFAGEKLCVWQKKRVWYYKTSAYVGEFDLHREVTLL